MWYITVGILLVGFWVGVFKAMDRWERRNRL